MELVSGEGMEDTSYTPPHVSSYLFLLPVYDAPSSAERRERIGMERGGREGGREGSGEEMVCQYSLCLRQKRRDRRGGEKKGKMVAKRDDGNTRVGSVRGTQEFTATRERL